MADATLLAAAPNLHMWVTFGIIAVAVVLFTIDDIPVELSTASVLVTFLVVFQLFPYRGPDGRNLLDAASLLAGFAHPVMFAIMGLLIMGQALFQTGAMEFASKAITRMVGARTALAIPLALIIAAMVSAFMNNTPVVVIFIPIIIQLAREFGQSAERALMPLSFVTILGGMTTTIGSSPNLIALSVAAKAGVGPVHLFDFFIPGIMLATLGFLYCVLVVPRLLPKRAAASSQSADADGKQFLVRVNLGDDHPWIGTASQAGFFPDIKDVTVRLVQREGRTILPPFADMTLERGDRIEIATTRRVLAQQLKNTAFVQTLLQDVSFEEVDTDRPSRVPLTMAEVVVAPASRLIGRGLQDVRLREDADGVILGIQRRSRMLRSPLADIRLEAGDVLLALGSVQMLSYLRGNRDLLLLEASATDLPITFHASRAVAIFAAAILAIALGLLPTAVAAMLGALAMLAGGCLNVRQASRAIDRQIYFLVGTAFAIALPLEVTGGAQFLARTLVDAMMGMGPIAILSALFLFTAILTNFLSNAATAALMAPIFVSTAKVIGADPLPFVYGLIFALNCSFASPIGYQTNLIVMGPGNYRFRDYIYAGAPLVLTIWLAYSLFAVLYYDLT